MSAILAQVALPGGAAAADDGNAAVSAGFEPETGQLGRPVIYRVRITASEQPLEPPELAAPAGLDMAFAGGGVSTVIINGRPMITSTFNYSVVPQRTGRFTMPAFEVAVGGRRVRVPPAVLTVALPDAGAAPYQPVRAELELPQRDFFAGESIGGRLLVIETPDESPQFISHVAKTTGAAVIRPSMRTSREQFTIGGKPHEGLVMPVRITPILEGELELGIQVVVRVQKSELPGQRGFGAAQSTIDTKPVRVRVLALPRAGRLPGFTGAIGKFTVAQPKLSSVEVEAGEPVTLTIAMAGEGNLEGVAAPEMGSAGGWEIYKPTSEFQPDPEDHTTARGAKVFTYTLIPSRAGLKATPAMPFCYFDPERRAYVDITIPPVPITVKASGTAPAPAGPETVKSEPRAEEPPRVVEPAMTGLAEKPGRWVHSIGPPLHEWWLLAAEAATPVLLLALWAWRRRRDWLAANPQIIRRRRAHAAARRALARARTAARKGDRGEFLRASAGALREAASPLDTARADSLTREDVLRLLHDDASASAVARKVLDSADAANYSTAEAAAMEPRTLLPELER
ncbi:MAG: BatD family protein, partial [Chthoniobacteraceae bacterium]